MSQLDFKNRRFSDDCENWMKNLSSELKNIPLINIAIPGSHDSMSYSINRKSPIAPDAEKSVVTFYKFVPCIVRRWAITQAYSTLDQLRAGIRYFDLRICVKEGADDFYFVHGLYCEEIELPLEELKDFLDAHPDEFVVLDCQHFYNFKPSDHVRLTNILLKTFGSRIYEREGSTLLQVTLSNAMVNKKQLLIIYRNSQFVVSKFWYSRDWPTPWPNQISIGKLQRFLDNSLEQRDPTVGYVSQVVLTPNTKFIVPRFFSTLRNKCAKPVNKKLSKWLMEQQPGPFIEGEKPKSNVFLADFVDIKNSNFCKIVIDLNHKIDLSSEIDIIDCWQIHETDESLASCETMEAQ